MPIRITATVKREGYRGNPYTSITHFEWMEDGTGNTGTWTRENMYYWIKNGGKAYVEDEDGNKVPLTTVKKIFGIRYVVEKTEAKNVSPLLNLKIKEDKIAASAITS